MNVYAWVNDVLLLHIVETNVCVARWTVMGARSPARMSCWAVKHTQLTQHHHANDDTWTHPVQITFTTIMWQDGLRHMIHGKNNSLKPINTAVQCEGLDGRYCGGTETPLLSFNTIIKVTHLLFAMLLRNAWRHSYNFLHAHTTDIKCRCYKSVIYKPISCTFIKLQFIMLKKLNSAIFNNCFCPT